MTYCLFAGRHELPANEGAICDSFNFESFTVNKSQLWDVAVKSDDVRLYVTGLTPALTQFIKEWVKHHLDHDHSLSTMSGKMGGDGVIRGSLVLLHFNNQTSTYVEQRLF